MITEAYCSFEVAKLLKEKGFNEKCRGGYHYEFDDNNNPIVMLEEWTAQPYNNDFVDEGFLCSAPTIQMAMAWLREMFHIHIRLIHSADESYKFEIYPMSGKYRCKCFEDYTYYSSYEETVEAALKYALENLI